MVLRGIPSLVAVTLICCVLPVWGHAILVSAVPASNAVVTGRSVPVKLRFNSRIDGKRSRLILVLPGGHERLLTGDQPSADTLTSDLTELAPGSYILRWQVLAGDGHISRGEVPFRAQ